MTRYLQLRPNGLVHVKGFVKTLCGIELVKVKWSPVETPAYARCAECQTVEEARNRQMVMP